MNDGRLNGAKAFLKIQEKLQAARNDPFSEHATAMRGLKELDKKRPDPRDIPPDNLIFDSKGRPIF